MNFEKKYESSNMYTHTHVYVENWDDRGPFRGKTNGWKKYQGNNSSTVTGV